MADTEPKNALWRRDEQLKRWAQSETNKESGAPKDSTKVKFQDGCVFLAACSSGEKEEIIKLLARGADINTSNIDGLTALHQSCIDDNLDMVKFLLDNGADINYCDNEGWTPLHATASCGYLEVAKYLIDQGGDVAIVNSDGELAYDIADGDDMEKLLEEEMIKHGIDPDEERNREEEMMLQDANQWLNNSQMQDQPHPKTGATSLHVAAAKGYIKVMQILMQAGADLDVRDFDGWTALHAAAHWGQEEACKLLAENLCDMEIKNESGQTAMDIADSDIEEFFADLKIKQAALRRDRENNKLADQDILSKGATPPKRRSSVTRMSIDQKQNVVLRNVEEERAQMEAMKHQPLMEGEDEQQKSESSISEEESSESETDLKEVNRQNAINLSNRLAAKTNGVAEPEKMDSEPTPSSKAGPVTPLIQDLANKKRDKETELPVPDSPAEKVAKVDTGQLAPDKPPGKADSKLASSALNEDKDSSRRRPFSTATIHQDNQDPAKSRSFEPPKRDEERETERKARAKRARETRRSTQGVTREDLERAEQTLQAAGKGSQSSALTETLAETDRCSSDDKSDKENKPEEISSSLRKKYGLEETKKEDDSKTSYRKAKDSKDSTSVLADSTSYRGLKGSGSGDIAGTDSSRYSIRSKLGQGDEDSKTDTKESKDDKDDPSQKSSAIRTRRKRENRRPTGKITADDIQGNTEEGEKDKGSSDSKTEAEKTTSRYGSSRYSDTSSSLHDRPSYSSSRPYSAGSYSRSYSSSSTAEKEAEYKKLYEEEKGDNEKLRKEVKRLQQERSDLERVVQSRSSSISSISGSEGGADRRERRALERKVSELEEELKQTDKLRAENAKLKEENRALTRVVSKLSKIGNGKLEG